MPSRTKSRKRRVASRWSRRAPTRKTLGPKLWKIWTTKRVSATNRRRIKKLMSRKVSRSTRVSRRVSRRVSGALKRRLSSLYKKTSRTRPALRAHIKRLISRTSEGRGSRLRGWAAEKPNTISQRRAMYKKYGAKCFLLPSQLKFPICPMGSGRPSLKGILAAKIRAKQHGYSAVYKKAVALERKLSR